MILRVSKNYFIDRAPRGYSIAALEALFNYYEELEDDMGEQIKYDSHLVSGFTEYKDINEVINDCPTVTDMQSLQSQAVVIFTEIGSLLVGEF